MTDSRNSVARRATWSGIDALAGPAASFFMTGGLIRLLGVDSYGALVVVLALSVFTLALGPAIAFTTTKLVAERAQEASSDGISRALSASLVVIGTVASLILLATITLSEPLTSLLFSKPTRTSIPNLPHVLIIAVATVCVQQIEAVFSAGLKGLEQFSAQALAEACARIGSAAAVVGAAWYYRNLEAALWVQLGCTALAAGAKATVLAKYTPGGRLIGAPSRNDFRPLADQGGWMWLTAIATAAFGTIDRIVIGRLLGSAAAAEFQVYIQISQLIHYLPTAIFAFSLPAFSRLSADAAGGGQAIRSLFRRILVSTAVAALCSGLLLITARAPIIDAVAGRAFKEAAPNTYVILVLTFMALSINIGPYYLLLGTGRSRMTSLITLASGSATLALTWVLAPALGLEGAGYARLAYAAGAMMLLIAAVRAVRRPH